MTSSNGNIFRVTGPFCREFTSHRWIPLTNASDAELWCLFYIRLNKRLSKQSRRRWFETPSRLLGSHCNSDEIPSLYLSLEIVVTNFEWTGTAFVIHETPTHCVSTKSRIQSTYISAELCRFRKPQSTCMTSQGFFGGCLMQGRQWSQRRWFFCLVIRKVYRKLRPCFPSYN